MKIVDRGPYYDSRRSFFVEDDFAWFISPHLWTSLAADAGSSVAHSGDAVPSTIALTTGATNNNECAVRTTNELFLFASDKPLFAEVRLQYAEAATDDAAIFFGFINAIAADIIVDGGLSMKTTASAAGIYKRKDTTVWRAFSSKTTTQTDTAGNTTAGGTAYQVLAVEAQPISSTELMVYPYVDGAQLLDTNLKPISQLVTFASATEMHLGVYVKAGGANSEVVLVDYLFGGQLR